jgi:hypothetical protein
MYGFVPREFVSLTIFFSGNCYTFNTMQKVTIDQNMTVGTRQLAAIAKISPEMVRWLARQKIIPKAGRDRYELSNVLPSLYRYLWRSSCRPYVFREIEMPFGF